MNNLLKARLTAFIRSFTFVKLDYFGLFTVAHTLSANSWFIRRDVPLKRFSDPRINSVVTNKKLEVALVDLNQMKIVLEVVSSNTQWSLLPSASLHIDGARLTQIFKQYAFSSKWLK